MHDDAGAQPRSSRAHDVHVDTPDSAGRDANVRPTRHDSPEAPSEAWSSVAIAHEIRAPLAAIAASAEVLPYVAADQDEVSRVATRIADCAATIDRLLGNILDLERALRRGVGVHPQSVDIGARLRVAVDAMGREDISVVLDAPDRPAWVDPFFFDRIVTNLLGNAVRYAGDCGPITMRAHHHESRLILAVSDLGPGVAAADRERIFLPFERGRNGVGAGIGLALVRLLAEAHGGTATVSDRVGAPGAVFTVDLACAAPAITGAVADPSSPAASVVHEC